jgi:hypothetical protein
MNENKATVSSSLLEAMKDYAIKINKIRTHDPRNKVELACLYSGISGIKECMTALRINGFISEPENEELENEIQNLYDICKVGC